MNEAEKFEMIQRAATIFNHMADIINRGDDLLQAMFKFTKLAVKAEEWNKDFNRLRKIESELRSQGKASGWETAAREQLLIRAYELLEDEEAGREPRWYRAGLLTTYKQSSPQVESKEENPS